MAIFLLVLVPVCLIISIPMPFYMRVCQGNTLRLPRRP
jgi:hypothetical protein